MSEEQDYEFKMFEEREQILQKLSDEIMKCETKLELNRAKMDVKAFIRHKINTKNKDMSQVLKTFGTSFENAKEMVFTNRENMRFEREFQQIMRYEDHDGEIRPEEIDGNISSMIIRNKNKETKETKKYPIVEHSSGHRVCTCPSQKYNIVCKHTIARYIIRNFKGEIPRQQ